MKSFPVDQIRNVGLFSHGGHGKTTLAEALAYNSGAIGRLGRVEEGTTTSDYDAEEVRRHVSVQLSVLPMEWKGKKINLVDSPGYSDFYGEALEALRVVDAAILVFEAVSGVEFGAERVWKYAQDNGLPRLIAVGKMDRENADFGRAVDQIRERFGKSVVPIQIPIGSQAGFDGVVDLLSMKAYRGNSGEPSEIPTDLQSAAESAREQLIEAAAEGDDDLLSKYLDGETLSAEEIRHGLGLGIQSGAVAPVVCFSGLQNKAIKPLLDAIADLVPSPAERGPVKALDLTTNKTIEVHPTESAPLSALIFKSTADPHVGKLSYFRVFSGVLHSDSHVWNANRQHDERLGQLFTIRGKAQEPVVQLGPGEIGAVAKLADTGINDTLCGRETPLKLDPIVFPEPLFATAISPKTRADLDKLGAALTRLQEEDPTLRVHKHPDTLETLVEGLGESHIDIAAERLHRKYGVDVELAIPRVPYKETIGGSARAEYKHKKQTGGHGQYGHVFLEVEPLPRGSGVEFAEKVVGGSVPKNYIPAVEKGVREAVPEGFLAGYPLVDVRVTLYDGSYHQVDSSEMAFKIAAQGALKKALEQARPTLLEPIGDLTVTVPDQYVGDVMGDLNTRRARVHGMTPASGVTAIDAEVPLAEVQRYATDLRSLTQGRGSFTLTVRSYEEVPVHIAQTVIGEHKKEHPHE